MQTSLFGFNIPLSPYIVAPIFLVCWVLILNLIRISLFYRLKKIAQKTKSDIDDILFAALRFPVLLIIFASGLWITIKAMPTSLRLANWTNHTVLILLIFAVAYFINRIISNALDSYSDRQDFIRNSQGILNTLVKVIVIGLAALVFLDSIGVSITPLLASLGVGSVAVALALQDTLNNLFSGVYLLLDRPIQKGDFVKLESGEEGFVEKVGWRSTRIRMLPNNIVIIPNSKISGSTLTNYYLPEREMSVLVQVGVAYGSDLEEVEKVTIEVAKEIQQSVEGAIKEHQPFIRFHTFDSSSINFSVILRAQEFVGNYLIKHEFIKALQKRYAQEGINIPFPIRTLHIPEQEQAFNVSLKK